MKKSVIKRRKRVVPATHEQSPSNFHLKSFPRSVSPDSQHADIPHSRDPQELSGNINPDGSVNLGFRSRGREGNLSNHHRGYEPPPIDFTGYQVDRSPSQANYSQEQQHVSASTVHAGSRQVSGSTQLPMPVSSSPPRSTRKRSFSIAEGDSTRDHHAESARSNRLGSISSILNPAQQTGPGNVPIDPSLTAIDRDNYQQPHQQPHQQPQPSSGDRSRPAAVDDPGGKEKSDRRAQLQREAEQMREMLKAKERELAEFSGEG